MKPLHILLLGNNGQLGWELERTLASLGTVSAYDYPEIDLSQEQNLRQLLGHIQPNLIVNATAYTAVDRAESEPELAYAVNQNAPRILAEEAQKLDCALVHFSTDYVFDGSLGKPYTENDVPNPLSVYGQSKLDGERAIQGVGGAYIILRTSWVYSLRRASFVTKVMEWARQHRELRLVTDQVSGPTWCRSLAETTAHLLARGSRDILPWIKEHAGLYHLAGSGFASRLEWGLAVLRFDPHREDHVVEAISPASTIDFPTPARRPLFSALNCDLFNQTFDLRLPDWEYALRLAMDVA
jgi:dTDP-4-dehydrorhamnose reductase